MYKLNGYTRGEWFEPETQGMILQERDSTSTITLGPDAPAIGFNDRLLDDSWPEGVYVWRVKNINEQKDTETNSIELEHVIKALEDQSLFGEVTTAMMAGSSGATTVSAETAFRYILSLQSDWVLGDFEYNVSNPYEFDGDSLLDALETITDTLENAVWEYNMSTYPYTIHVRQRSSAVACEMRGGRNLSTMKKSVSRSGMYTRIYPVGKNDLHIDGEYLSKNESVYGRIDKIETDQSKSTKENLQAWAQGLLNRHSEPTVTITISGLELSAETGEDLDRLKMNRVCRVPLPEFGTTIEERIVKLQWRDRKAEPESVTVSLCNSSADVASIIKSQSKKSGKAAKGNAKQNYLFEANGEHFLYELYDESGYLHGRLEMTEERLRINFENDINSTRSEFQLTSESLRIQFMNDLASTRSEFQMTSESLRIQFANDIASTRSEFQMTSESLRIAFANDLASTRSEFQMTSESLRIQFANDIASTRSEFQMTSESLRIAFANDLASTRSEFQMTSESLRIVFENDLSSVRAAVETTASTISMVVEGTGSNARLKKAQICLAMNGSGGSSAYIDASKITLGSATQGGTQVSIGDVITVQNTGVSGGVAFKKKAVFQDALYVYNHNLDAGNLINLEYALVSADVINNSNKLEIGDAQGNKTTIEVSGNSLVFTDKDGHTFSFSKATTLSPTWSSGSFPLTISASPQNVSKTVGFTNASDIYLEIDKNGTPSQFGNSKKLINVPYKIVQHETVNGQTIDSVRYTGSLAAVDATIVWDACYNTLDITGTTNSKTLGYGESASVVVKLQNSSGTNVDRLLRTYTAPADRYYTGWDDCYNTLSATGTTASGTLSYGGSASVVVKLKNSSGTMVDRVLRTYYAPTDSNITARNIKHGVTIFGTTGNYGTISDPEIYIDPDPDTSSATVINGGQFIRAGVYNPDNGFQHSATWYVKNDPSKITVTTPTGATYGGYTNTSYGCYINSSSKEAWIVIKCQMFDANDIQCGSDLYRYIYTAATNCYRLGYNAGLADATPSYPSSASWTRSVKPNTGNTKYTVYCTIGGHEYSATITLGVGTSLSIVAN